MAQELTPEEQRELIEVLADCTPGPFDTGGIQPGQVWSQYHGKTVALFGRVPGYIDDKQRDANQRLLILARKLLPRLLPDTVTIEV